MNIKPRKPTSEVAELSPEAVRASGDFICIDLTKHYRETAISEVWLHRKTVTAMLEWVNLSRQSLPVPEVGGFLLGKKVFHAPYYSVSLEEFVPSTVIDYQSPTLLDFGTAALVELDNAREQSPQTELIGWFHTHPGHTPYLSGVDMGIHEGFFRQLYHLAVVLDSLTAHYDTGFFPRRPNGKVNNKTNLLGGWIPFK